MLQSNDGQINLNGTLYAPVVPSSDSKRRRGRPLGQKKQQQQNRLSFSQIVQQQQQQQQIYHSTQKQLTQRQKTVKTLPIQTISVEQLLARIEQLEAVVRQLKIQVAKANNREQPKQTTIVNEVTKEQRERENRAKNVVVRGLKVPNKTNEAEPAITETVKSSSRELWQATKRK